MTFVDNVPCACVKEINKPAFPYTDIFLHRARKGHCRQNYAPADDIHFAGGNGARAVTVSGEAAQAKDSSSGAML